MAVALPAPLFSSHASPTPAAGGCAALFSEGAAAAGGGLLLLSQCFRAHPRLSLILLTLSSSCPFSAVLLLLSASSAAHSPAAPQKLSPPRVDAKWLSRHIGLNVTSGSGTGPYVVSYPPYQLGQARNYSSPPPFCCFGC